MSRITAHRVVGGMEALEVFIEKKENEGYTFVSVSSPSAVSYTVLLREPEHDILDDDEWEIIAVSGGPSYPPMYEEFGEYSDKGVYAWLGASFVLALVIVAVIWVGLALLETTAT